MRSKMRWRPERVTVANVSDEVWVEVKCQTNQEIACSPRNSFRASVLRERHGGRALDGLGGQKATQPNQTPNAMMHAEQSDHGR